MKVFLSEYTKFEISENYVIPSSLHKLIHKIWQNHYEELYEYAPNQVESLEDSCLEILDFFSINKPFLSHYRYLVMSIILAESIRPTIDAYLTEDSRIQVVFQEINKFLADKKEPNFNLIEKLFPVTSEGSQALDEVLDVLKNSIKVLDIKQSKEALLNILDDCLEGYAIFPGSQGRRDLFNWWLLEVVPASWCLQFPNQLYTINGIKKTQNSQQVEAIAQMARGAIADLK
ncbi:hypothetical protein [Crocosphaera sp. Alani8]|uniref:hypothetical protein n=1 Tax=Crocosphaera sp. Alani8 TaxID=3038952 RepID=UPI00313D3C05